MNNVRWLLCMTIFFLATGCATQGAAPISSPAPDSSPSTTYDSGSKLSDKKLKELGINETQGSY